MFVISVASAVHENISRREIEMLQLYTEITDIETLRARNVTINTRTSATCCLLCIKRSVVLSMARVEEHLKIHFRYCTLAAACDSLKIHPAN